MGSNSQIGRKHLAELAPSSTELCVIFHVVDGEPFFPALGVLAQENEKAFRLVFAAWRLDSTDQGSPSVAD